MKKLSIRQDVYLFLKNPDYNKLDDLSVTDKIKVLLKVMVLTYVGLFLVSIPVSLLKKLEVIGQLPMKTDIILNSIQANNLTYKPYYIFSIILFVPLLEELSFRLVQTKFRTNYFIISVSVLTTFFIQPFIGRLLWFPKSYFLLSISGFLYCFLLSTLVGSVLYRFREKIKGLEEFWNNNTRIIIYVTATLFAVSHIMNLQFENRDILFMPIILLPFLVYGLSFGYLRVRLGLLYSIALHFVFLALRFGLPELALLLKDHAAK